MDRHSKQQNQSSPAFWAELASFAGWTLGFTKTCGKTDSGILESKRNILARMENIKWTWHHAQPNCRENIKKYFPSIAALKHHAPFQCLHTWKKYSTGIQPFKMTKDGRIWKSAWRMSFLALLSVGGPPVPLQNQCASLDSCCLLTYLPSTNRTFMELCFLHV